MRQCGYVKLDYLARTRRKEYPRLFADGRRPVVLYNPHFDPKISSWRDAQRLIEIFAGQDHYNLIVAPHIRISEGMTAHEMAEWHALAVPGRIIIDFHSRKMVDMSYVLASDIYLGDVSSQLYEFLHEPRPVAFLNSHQVHWADDPRYAGWRLGSVATDADNILDTIHQAVMEHPGRIEDQEAAVDNAFGDWRGASVRGAEAIGTFLGL
ncbi:hypothetical protein SCLO_1007340 [Sphingobium cloacae]|uniref:Glycosyl transferase n=1 Tax=Sphingobium cloacae TaxID=120107 RepID=A0A1E1EZV4_9SPHN|nr:hypothetical protein SCLO_1007340 [Sphingobium cloacae]